MQAALWVVLSFAFAALLVLVGPFDWAGAVGISAVNWLPWAALTPVIFWLARRFPLERGRLLPSVPVHLIAGVACTALCLWISASAFPMRPGGPMQGNFRGFGRGGPDNPDQRRFATPPGAWSELTDAERAKRREEFFNRKRLTNPEERFGRGGPDGGFPRGDRGGGPGGPGGPDEMFPGGRPGESTGFFSRWGLRRDFFEFFGPFALRGNFGL